ncbi:hypothetical protein O6H91_14G017000 [Diphasiastrum complanatum]|uniref:Uncharacterized protein n=1 Tax=Diphasiastrum complanatum TaxID=34168 RepID=A0ACC2BLX0_DIPCM|nr:hypothetical protein O6H91_14G017000 [Diphasiastrum complanatum]
MEGNAEEDEEILKLREQRRQLKEQITNQRRSREQLVSNISTQLPDLASSLELTLKVVSSLGGLDIKSRERPFQRQGSLQPLDAALVRSASKTSAGDLKGLVELKAPSTGRQDNLGLNNRTENEGARESTPGALTLVKSMVANCLLSSSGIVPIDSTGIYRRLAKSPTSAEKDAIAEVGGEGGGVAAVEAALRALAVGPGAGIEIDECALGGKTRLMVLTIDRNRLSKELPGLPLAPFAGAEANPNSLMGGPGALPTSAVGMENGAPSGHVPSRGDMWVGGGVEPPPHLQSISSMPGPGPVPGPGPGPPIFPGSGPPPLMGPRGGPRVMGMMGMPGPGGVPGINMGYGVLPPFQRPPIGPGPGPGPGPALVPGPPSSTGKNRGSDDDVLKDLEALLSKKSFRELQKSKTGEELLDLLHRPTAKETAVAAKFKTKGGSALKEYCPALTKEDCRRQRGSYLACEKVHFRRIIAPHTDINLGDCSFLDTCRHMKTCKYVHYELDPTPDVPGMIMGPVGLPPPQKPLLKRRAEYCSEVELGEPQWINCDIRSFRMDVLGQFGVIMADPPWDIHMELPYGTMADDEMRSLNVPALQTDGMIFLWVTGRAMELGRECLELWGYKRVEELIWVKTNQLQRIIRTGRTGHWLNHSKEHCLVGIKGHPEVNRNIDTDVIVAEVRETSRKPDEMYPMLERISPRTRKLELFARMHNTHAGWISLGNQLNGVRLVDEGLRARFKAAYPDVEVQPPDPPVKPSTVEGFCRHSRTFNTCQKASAL